MAVIAVTEGQTLTPHTAPVFHRDLGVTGGRLGVGRLLVVPGIVFSITMIWIIGRRNTEGIGHAIISSLRSSVPSWIIATMLSSSFPISIISTWLTSSVAHIPVISSRC